jgi:hypothetical protein
VSLSSDTLIRINMKYFKVTFIKVSTIALARQTEPQQICTQEYETTGEIINIQVPPGYAILVIEQRLPLIKQFNENLKAN